MGTTNVNATAPNRSHYKYTGQSPISAAKSYACNPSIASGTVATITISPADNPSAPDLASAKGVVLHWIDFAYAATPTAGSWQISDGTTTIGPFPVAAAGYNQPKFDPPLVFAAGANVVITLADGSQTKTLGAAFSCEGGSAI